MLKKAALFLWTLAAVIILLIPVTARAEDTAIWSALDDALASEDAEISTADAADFDLTAIAGTVRDKLAERVKAPLKVLAVMLTVIVLSAVISTSVSETNLGIISVLGAAAVLIPEVMGVYDDAFSAVNRTGGFISVFVPVFAGLTAAVGSLASAGAYNIFILAASEFIVRVTENVLIPLVGAITALAVSGSVFADSSLEKLVGLIKKAVLWFMTSAMTLFTGVVTMKCTIASKADGAASKAVKLAISGAVPIVGGAVADAYSTVRGSFDVIRSSVGAVGASAIIVIMLPPVIEIAAFRLAMWISSAAAELFSVNSMTKLLDALDSGLAVIQSVLVCYSVIFILCTGILLNCCGD